MSEAEDIGSILVALKKVYRAAGVRQKDIAEALGVSLMTVKRLMSGKGIRLVTLMRLCAIVDLTVYELMEIVQKTALNETPILSPEQMRALESDLMLATTFFLMERGWSADRISEEFALDDIETTRILTRLDRLQIIALFPGNRFRILLRRGKPTRDATISSAPISSAQIADFFSPMGQVLTDPAVAWASGVARLSDASLKRVVELFEQMRNAVFDLGEQDLSLPAEAVRWYGTLAVARPFDIGDLKSGGQIYQSGRGN